MERLPVAKVMNIARALDEHGRGIPHHGAAFGEGNLDLHHRLHTPALLVLGNEEHGIRPQVAKRCHHLLHPMLRTFDSLNVAQAGGILTSCFARQHLEKNPSGE
ncbi:MAG: TrmH family RNA methyltransferase [Bilophila wadsworthia]